MIMEKKTLIIFISFCGFLSTVNGDHEAPKLLARPNDEEDHRNGTMKLFVFGDSYVDTGNSKKSFDASWKEPYGITFPGKPAGRFSDGRVLTDYLASYLGISSPVPFESGRLVTKSEQEFRHVSMNFAYGGTGVFNTLVNAPNMSTQISNFQQLIEDKWYTNQDLNTSIALVSLAGNDYGAQVLNHGNNLKELAAFSEIVVGQLVENLKRIQSLGVRKIAVNALQPLGCLPQLTAYSSGNSCNENWNLLSSSHNQKLLQQVQKLNNQTKKNVVVVLDLYFAFSSAIAKQMNRTAGNPLKPCCVGISSEYSCGSVDESGVKKYSVCKNPESSFFWDMIHPSQNGWQAVYAELEAYLYKLF